MEIGKKEPTIMFSGGGTGGPVTPLLAVAAELLKSRPDAKFIFVGTETGPVRELVAKFDGGRMEFLTIPSGKWRRYFSLRNFFDIFKIMAAFFKSLRILGRVRPDIVVSAGGFVSVPLVWAAACRRIPVLIHQQDMRAGLANRLMAPCARVITVSFKKSLSDYGPRAVLTGNPFRDIRFFQDRAVATRENYGFRGDKPLIMVIGGGTGALALNNLMAGAIDSLLLYCQIIHLTGKGKGTDHAVGQTNMSVGADDSRSGYRSFEFLGQEEVLSLMAAADLVVSRCGFGVLTELAALGKAAILIPMPRSHQEDNAAFFRSQGAAAVLEQDDLDADKLAAEIRRLLDDNAARNALRGNIAKIMRPEAAHDIAAIILELTGQSEKKA